MTDIYPVGSGGENARKRKEKQGLAKWYHQICNVPAVLVGTRRICWYGIPRIFRSQRSFSRHCETDFLEGVTQVFATATVALQLGHR